MKDRTTDMAGEVGVGAGLSGWLDGSAFVRDGVPVVWCHGTDTEDEFNVFARWEESSLGFHFGSAPTASARLSMTRAADGWDHDGCRIVPVYCRARRPLRLRDHHMWRLDRVAAELADRGLISPEVEEEIAGGCDEFALFAAIEAAGYDCVVYANETESEGRMDDSLIVWRPELVKGIHAASFDPADPRILPQRPTPAADMQARRDNAAALDDAARRIEAVGRAFVPG